MRTRIRQFARGLTKATFSTAPFASRKLEILRELTAHLPKLTTIAQGIQGKAELITGNFKTFTKSEARNIADSLSRGKTLVLVYDRDIIQIPANERAAWIRHHFNHHPNLEVRVAYAPPAEASNDYIAKQIPAHISITKHLALGETNDSLTTTSIKRLLNSFKTALSSDKFEALIQQSSLNLKEQIINANPFHPNLHHIFERTEWDLRQLNRCNLPVKVGHLGSPILRAAFSNPFQAQVFDMPIYMPGQGWKIPAEFNHLAPTIARIAAAESLANPNIKNCNVYITFDSGIVHPNGFARRGGLHVDGFLTNANARADLQGKIWGDNTYLISDVQELQTEFYAGPFDLSHVNINNTNEVLAVFNQQGKDKPFYQAKAYDIIKLTVNNVHAVHPNLTGKYLQRNFLKITFSERLFNRGGNTVNPSLNYRFSYVPRSADRNTQNFAGVVPYGFTEVNLSELDFKHKRFPEWVVPMPFTVRKRPSISIVARPAVAGTVVQTVVDGMLVTTNVALEKDMEITRYGGDKYLLNEKKFAELYKHENGDFYEPTARTLTAVTVKKPISFLASWGTLQNIPAGGVIVEDNHNEKWGIHQESFKATYLKV